jgi:hypothetical protein
MQISSIASVLQNRLRDLFNRDQLIPSSNMANSPTKDPEKKVLDDSNSDDDVLAQLGYTQGNTYCVVTLGQ